MSNETNIFNSLLGPTTTNDGYLGIDCPNSCISLMPVIDDNPDIKFDISLRTDNTTFVGGNLDNIDMTGTVDVLILIRPHKDH